MFQLTMSIVCYVCCMYLMVCAVKSYAMWAFMENNEKRMIACAVLGTACLLLSGVLEMMYLIAIASVVVMCFIIAYVCLAFEAGKRRYELNVSIYKKWLNNGYEVYMDEVKVQHPTADLIWRHTLLSIDRENKKLVLLRRK